MDIIVRSGKDSARDARGERVYFKEPYYDQAARQVFRSADDKARYLQKNGAVQNGDSDAKVKKERQQLEQKMRDEKRR